MATIREIAAKSGYSPATVSRLLNNDPSFSISDTARKRILKAAAALNYQKPNTTHGRSYQIGVVFAVQPQQELEDVYFSDLRKSIVTYGEQAGLRLTFYHQAAEIPATVDGVMAVGQFQSADIDCLRQLSPNRVFVDSNPDSHAFNSVQPNLQAMTERAIDLFLEQGCRPIGFIGGRYWSSNPQVTGRVDSRQKYFESDLRERQVFDHRFVFIGDNFSVESGYALGMRIAQSLDQQPLPKGFLVASDPLAVGVLQAFNQNKITVPVDTQLISINDNDIARYVSPPLTTFHINTDELGQQAVNLLKDSLIFDQHSHRTILLDGDLVYRKSFPLKET
ncbi:LacI family DNA-binding transcriptional regulator [Levilactobacillus spicheri]|uniref:Transcriptional regulator n=2 Tax=Levilactobacillus spicheri TaxID=216463 RepID=A0ABQ0WQA2_9LACO|nr:LacI family DNA-binding transcriptional regulator [Levilactobacillus spicheri]KRL47457.1 transcription regulator [Levilactobacillus spicheri DSM 15429]GEO67263.1 transcriptional regulator [Levilactobacillus spicheri]